MKITRIILIALMAVTTMVSCSKNHDKTYSIEGLWEGTYVNQASGSTFFFSFNIKPGGVIEEINSSGQKIGEGTWELENNILLAHYSWPGGASYTVVGAFDSSEGRILGDWGYGSSSTDGGTWQMTKK